jgi:large repetitive protein
MRLLAAAILLILATSQPLAAQVTLSPTVTDPPIPQVTSSTVYQIKGDAEADSLVRVYTDLNDNGAIDSGVDTEVANLQLTGGATNYFIDTPLVSDTDNNFLVTAEAASSTESVSIDVPTITQDSTPPAPPTIVVPAAPATISSGTFLVEGTAEAGTLVLLYRDANNNGVVDGIETTTVQSQQLSTGQTAFAILVPTESCSINHYLVVAADAAGLSAATSVPAIKDTSCFAGSGGAPGGQECSTSGNLTAHSDPSAVLGLLLLLGLLRVSARRLRAH